MHAEPSSVTERSFLRANRDEDWLCWRTIGKKEKRQERGEGNRIREEEKGPRELKKDYEGSRVRLMQFHRGYQGT